MTFVACQKETVKEEEPVQAETHLTLNFTINHGEATKAVKTDWEYGDRIHIYFDRDFSNGGKYLDLEYQYPGNWVGSWSDGLEAEIAGKTSGTLDAYYIPFRHMDGQEWGDGTTYYNVTTYDKPWLTSVDRQPTGRPVYTFFLQAWNVAYTVSGGALSATFTMSLPSGYDFVHFFLEGEGKIDYSDSPRFTITTIPAINSVALTRYDAYGFHTTPHAGMVGYDYCGGTSFTGVLTPEAIASSSFTFLLTDNNGTPQTNDDRYYRRDFSGKSLSAGSAIKLPPLSAWDEYTDVSDIFMYFGNIPSAVPMFQYDDPRNPLKKHVVYFGEYNLGADTKQAPIIPCFGQYFAWGETEGNPFGGGRTYDWANYAFSAGSKDGSQFTKYVFNSFFGTPDIDGSIGTLEAIDDAASVAFGGNWRMPSSMEWDLLKTECDWVWDNVNQGFVITARAPYAGNQIFLPQARMGDGSGWDYDMAAYWSANGGNDTANALVWNNGDPASIGTAALFNRCLGGSIRPVFDEIIAPMP